MQRFTVTSTKPFADVIADIEAAIGHPEKEAFRRDATAARIFAELEHVINNVLGPSGLIEFTRLDLGEVLGKEYSERAVLARGSYPALIRWMKLGSKLSPKSSTSGFSS